jgi:hypothetical protein
MNHWETDPDRADVERRKRIPAKKTLRERASPHVSPRFHGYKESQEMSRCLAVNIKTHEAQDCR